MNKKKILITGSTDGIGKLVAIKLAQDGHEIFVHGRNSEKLKSVISEIKEKTNNEAVDGFTADFSNLQEVRKMSIEIKSKLNSLDVLINNAGVFKTKSVANDTGHDLRYVVNYFAPYLLTKEIISLLESGSEPRIINLSSAAQSSISYDVMQGKEIQGENATYAQSKLALTMWSFWLAKQNNTVSVIAVNPGSLLNTNMVKEAYGHHWSSADKGANILYDLATNQKYNGITGKYFDNDNGGFGKAHADAYNPNAIEKLIQETDLIIHKQKLIN